MSSDDSALGAPPDAYARGTQGFMGLELLSVPGVLVPREETELLARTALGLLAEQALPSPRVIDMCAGSGNLACAIATGTVGAELWASDLTDACASLARRNVERLGLGERVTVLRGDLFEPLVGLGLETSIDLVVCNPPYISSGRLAERADLAHEPREAFDGGPYGLSIHQRVVKDALSFLKPGGVLMFEFGLGQERQLEILFDRARAYDTPELVRNRAGEPRVAYARKRAPSR